MGISNRMFGFAGSPQLTDCISFIGEREVVMYWSKRGYSWSL